MPPAKKKGNKKVQSQPAVLPVEDPQDELDIAFTTPLPLKKVEDEPLYNMDEEGNDLGGLMSIIAHAKKGGKKKKKKNDSDDDLDAAEILARLDAQEAASMNSGNDEGTNKKEKKKKGKKGANEEVIIQSKEGSDDVIDSAEVQQLAAAKNDSETDEPEEFRIKSKKEKEREKKERQKLAKKQETKKKEGSEVKQKPETAPAPSVSEAAFTPSTVPAESDETPATSDSKKKKKKKKGEAAPEPEPAPVASAAASKKKKAPLAALQKILAAQKAAEEEARRQAEEEERLIREEEERLKEIERQKLENKLKKKEREKQKKEELKKSGQYLTPAQKAKEKAQQEKLAAMLASGVKVAALQNDGGEKKKKPIYGKKKKPQQNQQVSSKAEPSEKNVENDEESGAKTPMEDEFVVVEKEDLVPDIYIPLRVVHDDEITPEDEDVKDSWDISDDEEEEIKKKAAAEAKKAAEKAKTVVVSPPAKQKPVANDEESESESEDESEEESDEESDEDTDDSEEEELTSTQKIALQKKQEAIKRRQERIEQALKARSKDDLRSPICVILGHVDTGKTKLLDKIRQTNVQEGEAGGITQQIGATYFPVEAISQKTAKLNSDLEYKVPGLLMIDTPGHESFTNLRSRGSSLCNIAILVVDITAGLEQQTIESLNLLKQRKTPFIVALNKVDRLYGWKSVADSPIRDSLALQSDSVLSEYKDRVQRAIVAFAEQGLNAVLYYENKNFAKNVSLVPTSAITGEGIPDLLHLLISLTQSRMTDSLMYLSEIECTVLEVKVIEGHGTTIDVILSNGVLNDTDRIVVCGMNGAIVTNIRALLTPQPMRELRVKSQYVHHKQVKAALGVKISAPDLDKAIAGSRLLVVGPDDDEEELKEEVMSDLTDLFSKIDKKGRGVCVQASTLGSLEALLEFLNQMKIPVSGINIGPVHKKDIIRCSVMLERAREYAQLLAFDVPIDKEAQDLAEEVGVKIFKADIIYHLFDSYVAYMNEIQEMKKRDEAPKAVFPCVLKIIPTAIFNKRNPIILGVDVIEGSLRLGTPLAVITPEKEVLGIGRVSGIELNHKARDTAKRGDAVAIKIEVPGYETPKLYGRHFDHTNELYSSITRQSIDILKNTFRDQMTDEDWKTVIKLKKILQIDNVIKMNSS